MKEPEKYKQIWYAFGLEEGAVQSPNHRGDSVLAPPRRPTQAYHLALAFERAIRDRRPGFLVSDSLSLRDAAKEIGVSRTTLSLAFGLLFRAGYLAKRNRAAFKVISDTPTVSHSEHVLDDKMSGTRMLIGREIQWRGPLLALDMKMKNDPLVDLLLSALSASSDPVIRGARQQWRNRSLFLFTRLRVHKTLRPAGAFLFELSYINIPDESRRAEFAQRVLAVEAAPAVSLYRLIDPSGAGPILRTKTYLCLQRMPAVVASLVENLLRQHAHGRKIDSAAFQADEPALRWDYALLNPYDSDSVINYSICYVDTRYLRIAIQDMEWRLP